MKWKSNITGKVRKKNTTSAVLISHQFVFRYSTLLHIVREGAVAAHKDVDILTGQSSKSTIVGPCEWDAVIIYVIITPVLLPSRHVKLPQRTWADLFFLPRRYQSLLTPVFIFLTS